MNKKHSTILAFTLAEVLITLGIIGVVASLTMPSLIANTRKNTYSVRLKKFYSVMQQAILMYNAENGTMSGEWEEPTTTSESIENYWNIHFGPYFKNVLKLEKKFTGGRNGLIVYFEDGSTLVITRGGAVDLRYDVNGEKPPNVYGRDNYIFLLRKGEFSTYNWENDIGSGGIIPDEGEADFTKDMNDRNNVLRLCKKAALFCGHLLLLDGWEYKEDYPYRL